MANDAASGATIAMNLIDAFSSEGEVVPHGGVTFGPVVNRRGDYYGPVVNLASRIARQSVPGEVPGLARHGRSAFWCRWVRDPTRGPEDAAWFQRPGRSPHPVSLLGSLQSA